MNENKSKNRNKDENKTQPAMPHRLMLDDREQLTATGVSDVDSFDEDTVKVYTDFGELTVRGEHLHISRLNLETGELALDGTVRSMTYENAPTRSGGVLGRLFR